MYFSTIILTPVTTPLLHSHTATIKPVTEYSKLHPQVYNDKKCHRPWSRVKINTGPGAVDPAAKKAFLTIIQLDIDLIMALVLDQTSTTAGSCFSMLVMKRHDSCSIRGEGREGSADMSLRISVWIWSSKRNAPATAPSPFCYQRQSQAH
ncbi:hypothetical protein BT96DRAFT_422919 [Gymnopus androsaceus JB14]|uniref:Uncharacterized protein n=1 Tax=Gymnopus androsaceus JB14 TaxID=1447944 RepID=A0A6A4GU90_9AGAR|nr:hypothetical protein BT96DRAFT_422919 [Gymnopus androsaceus JB14]